MEGVEMCGEAWMVWSGVCVGVEVCVCGVLAPRGVSNGTAGWGWGSGVWAVGGLGGGVGTVVGEGMLVCWTAPASEDCGERIWGPGDVANGGCECAVCVVGAWCIDAG